MMATVMLKARPEYVVTAFGSTTSMVRTVLDSCAGPRGESTDQIDALPSVM